MTTIDEPRDRGLPPEPELTLSDFNAMAARMRELGLILEASNPSSEVVLFGAGDTGTIQTSADIDNSDFLLALARPKFPGSFSEENDPLDNEGNPVRQRMENLQKGYWMIDPVDGTGDRRYGEPETPERRGYSILNTFIKDGNSQAGIVFRPAYAQEITYRNGQIYVSENGVVRPLNNHVRPTSESDVVRVNSRLAYPGVGFPPDFWDFAYNTTGIRFQEVRSGGAGDSLSKLVLGEIDLVVAIKGDWKSWDTGPFDPMINSLGGRLTNCDNTPLRGYNEKDLWHRRGVIASINRQDAHIELVRAMEAYKQIQGVDLVIEPPQKP